MFSKLLWKKYYLIQSNLKCFESVKDELFILYNIIINYTLFMKPSIPINSALKYDYKRFIKPTKHLIDPYHNEIFKYKELESENHKGDKIKK